MKFEKYRDFFQWMTSGAAAASLALFVFVPSVNTSSAGLKIFSACLFLFAMLTLVAATAIGKLIADAKKEDGKAESIHSLVTTAGFTSFFIGLATLAVNMSLWLAIPLMLGLVIALVAFGRAHNSLLH